MSTMEMRPALERENAPLDHEPSPEELATMESFREERKWQLTNIFKSRYTEATLAFLPGTDVLTFAMRAAEGTTLSGKEINKEDRIYYAATAGLYALSYVLASTGFLEEGKTVRATAIGLGMVNFGPGLIEKAGEIAKGLPQKMDSLIEKTRGFIKNRPSVMEEVEQSMNDLVTNE